MNLDLELLASIASGGLGQWVEGPNGQPLYAKSDDCIGCLKDLQRFLRYDDPEDRPAFFAVHKFNLARSDLVPLIVTYPEEYDLVYNTLKVCTFMTMPSTKESGTNLRQQAEHVQRVREAFLAQDALVVIVGLLADPLAHHPRMKEEDIIMVQLVITFLRNLVAIPTPPPPAAGSSSGQADAHRRIKRGLLERLFADNVMDLLLLLAQHAREQPFRSETPVLVEILLHLLKDLEPQELLDAEAAVRSEQEQQAQQTQRVQQAALAKQRALANPGPGAILGIPKLPPRPGQVQAGLVRLPKALPGSGAVGQGAPPRHPRSDAVFVRRHADHNRSVVLHHNPTKSELPQLPAVTNKKLAQAEKRDGAGGKGQPRLGAGLMLRMRQFVESFLGAGYGILMGQMFKELQPGLGVSRLEEPDFLNFVELATLATHYVRVKEERKLHERQRQQKEGGGEQQAAQEKGGEEASPFAPISATMGWDAFFWCLKLWLAMKDGAREVKARDRSLLEWRLQHASVPLLKEMLLTLDLARLVGNASDRRAADRLQRRLMHDDLKESGLLPVLAQLIKNYDFRFQPRSHAVDLVEALHVVLGILDRLNSREAGGFRVRKKARAKPAHKPRVPHAAPQIGDAGREGEGQAGCAGAAEQQQDEEEGEQGKGGRQSLPPAANAGAASGGQPSGRGQGEGGGEVTSPVLRPARPAEAVSSGSPAAMDLDGAAAGEGAAEEIASPAAAAAAAATPMPARPPAPSSSNGGEVAGAPGAAGPAAAAAAAAATPGDDCISIAGKPAGTRGGGAGGHSPAAPLTGGGRVGDPLEEEEEEEDRGPKFQEVNFDMQARLRQECAYPALVHFYCWLLQGYRTNAPFTNRALVAFLERITDPKGLDLEPMLYQLSVLRVFHAILSDAPLRRQPEFAGLIRFCTRVVRSMFARLVPDLSEVQGRLREAEAALARTEAQGEGEGDSGLTSAQEAGKAKKGAELEIKLREACASLGFVELLFWKGANVAGDVRDEYNWKKIVDPPTARRRGRRRAGGRDEDGFSSGDEPEMFAFGDSSRSRKPTFDEERTEQLRAAFERCNGRKECLELLVHEFGGLFKKVHISRQLKAMRLVRRKFTLAQEERLKALYAENSGALDCFDLMAEELAAGFSAAQVKRQLRKMGLLPGAGGKKKGKPSGKQAAAWDALGDDEDSGDEAHPARSGGGLSPEIGDADGNSNSSDAGSDGFESAKSDMDDSDSEDEGGEAGGAGPQRLGKALGGDKAKSKGGSKMTRRQSALGTLPFGSWDEDDDLALGAGGKEQREKQGTGAEEATMGSPELGVWVDGDGAAIKAGATTAKLPWAQQQQQQRRGRLRKAGLGAKRAAATPTPASIDEDSDSKGPGGLRAGTAQPAAKRSRAQQALMGSESSASEESGGGQARFVTVEGSKGGSGAGQEEEADTTAQQPPAQRSKGGAAAAAATATGAGGKQAGQASQQEMCKKRASPASAIGSGPKMQPEKKKAKATPSQEQQPSGSDSDSEGGRGNDGFVSAGESDPESETSQAPLKQAKRAAAAGEKAAAVAAPGKKAAAGKTAAAAPGKKAAAANRRREAAAESDSGDDDAPLWTAGAKSKASKASPTAGAAAAAAARPGQPSAGGEAGKRKRRASAEEAGGATAHRAAALEQLRRRRLGAAAGRGDECADAAAAAAALPPATEPFGEWQDFTEREDRENEAPLTQQASKPGRRLLKKAGASAAGPAPAPTLEDLEDF